MSQQTLQDQIRRNADLDDNIGGSTSTSALSRQAADRIDELERQLAEAQKDQSRLDWLQSKEIDHIIFDDYTLLDIQNGNIRESIEAAIQKVKP